MLRTVCRRRRCLQQLHGRRRHRPHRRNIRYRGCIVEGRCVGSPSTLATPITIYMVQRHGDCRCQRPPVLQTRNARRRQLEIALKLCEFLTADSQGTCIYGQNGALGDRDFRTIPTFFAPLPQTPRIPRCILFLIPMLWHALHIQGHRVARLGLLSAVHERRMTAVAYGKERV
jgi:hypothetical protein